MQNVWQLHRLYGGKLDQLLFRRSVATAISESYKRVTKRGASKFGQNFQEYSRYDRKNHLIVYREKNRYKFCHKIQFFVVSSAKWSCIPRNVFIITLCYKLDRYRCASQTKKRKLKRDDVHFPYKEPV